MCLPKGECMSGKKEKTYTEGELDFMKVLWDFGESSPEKIQNELKARGRALTHGTIRNVLIVMMEKGFVARRKKGKSYIYRALSDADEAQTKLARNLLEKAFDGSESRMISALLKNSDVHPEELEKIERLIAEYKKGEGE